MTRINQSFLLQFMKCPEKARRIYLEHEISPLSFPLAKGITLHEVNQKNMERKLKTRRDYKKKRLVEYAVETFDTILKSNEMVEPKSELPHLRNKGQKHVICMTEAYVDRIAPQYQPTGVEIRHEVQLPNGVLLHGQLDLEVEGDRIVDLKTTMSTPSLSDLKSLQFLVYPFLFEVIHKRPAKEMVIEYITPSVLGPATVRQRRLPQRTKDDFVALINQVDAVSKMVQAGTFPGAYGNPAAWWCSKSNCAFWRTCKYVPKSQR